MRSSAPTEIESQPYEYDDCTKSYYVVRGELTPYRFMVRAIVAHRSSFSKFDRIFTTSTMTSTTRNVPDRSDAVSRYSTVGERGDLLVTLARDRDHVRAARSDLLAVREHLRVEAF